VESVGVAPRLPRPIQLVPIISKKKEQESVAPPRTQPPPLTKTDVFSTLVPIDSKKPTTPVPLDESLQDPRLDFYNALVSLADQPDNAAAAGWHVTGQRKLDTEDDRFRFVTRLIQFYVFRSVFNMHHGSQGMRTTVGGEVTPISRKALVPPNKLSQPSAPILETLGQNEFLTPMDELEMKTLSFNLPAGTSIRLFEEGTDPKKGKPFICIVRLERSNFFRIDFVIQPSFGSSIGSLPTGFKTQASADVQTYAITVSMNAEIQRKHTADFDAESYGTWAQAMFDAMNKAMSFD
jgi:hypothetical protein